MSFADVSLGGEQVDGLSHAVTNASTGVIGGSCTGGTVLLCIFIYFLYRLLRPEKRIEPVGNVIQIGPAEAVISQNRASCPRCAWSGPDSPPPPYSEELPMEECIFFQAV